MVGVIVIAAKLQWCSQTVFNWFDVRVASLQACAGRKCWYEYDCGYTASVHRQTVFG